MTKPVFPGALVHVTAVSNGNSVYLYGLDATGRLWWSSGSSADREWALTTGQFEPDARVGALRAKVGRR